MTRIVNDAGIELVKRFEGLRLEAYRDVAGVWTVGYGHTRGVVPGMVVTEEQADRALQDDLASAEATVFSATCMAPTNDDQFSAMVALCFNIGSMNFRGSTVLREHLARNRQAAADAFLLWNKAHVGGALVEVAGLTRRREAERALYLS